MKPAAILRPRWLFVDPSSIHGGHEIMLLRWLEELRSQPGIHATLLARRNSKLYHQARLFMHAVALPEQRIAPQPMRRWARMARRVTDIMTFIKQVRALKPQLAIVAEGCLLSHAWCTVLLRLLRVPTVIYVPLVEPARNMGFGRGRQRDWLMRHVYRHLASGWITITRDQVQQLLAWSGIRRPVFTLPNTVARSIESADVVRAPPATPLRVLVLGRLDAHQKGLDDLLDYLCRQAWLHERLHVSVVGDGPYRGELQQRLDRYAVLRTVLSLHCWAPTETVMREHDVLLLASRYEGVPLVMLEAMTLGLPVVASDLPGTRALLPPECRFEVGDFDRAMQILLSLQHPAHYHAVVQRNRATFRDQASGASFARASQQLVMQLAGLARSTLPVDAQLPSKR